MAGPLAAWAARAAAKKAATDPTVRNIAIGMAVLLLAVPVAVVGVPVAAVLTFMSSIDPTTQYCGAGYRTATDTGWQAWQMTAGQTATAATIVQAATAVSAEPKAAMAALMAAFLATDMGATATVSTHPTNDTPVGVFARTVRGGWGTLDELSDTATATARILQGNGADRVGVMTDPGWTDEPVGGWMAAIGMAEKPAADIASAADKARKWLASTGTTVAGTGASCGGTTGPVSADQVKLATDLMAAHEAGRLYGGDLSQIRDIAAGNSVPDCGVDVRILQVLTIALQHYTTVGFSDLNRKCTGVIAGAGTSSSHWINGGGHAVDITSLDGDLDGGKTETQSQAFISILDSVMPQGARVGQQNCRPGNPVVTVHLVQFPDECSHLHIDVAFTDDPLTIG